MEKLLIKLAMSFLNMDPRYAVLWICVLGILLWPLALGCLLVLAVKAAFRKKPKPSEVDFEGTPKETSLCSLPLVPRVTEGTLGS